MSNDRIIDELKRAKKKHLWPSTFLDGREKLRKKSFNIIGVLVEILTPHFLSTGLEYLCYHILFGPT
jgi:hypothetical protein